MLAKPDLSSQQIVSSSANQHVKAALHLKKRSARDKERLFLIEGEPEISRALRAHRELVTVFASVEAITNSPVRAVVEGAKSAGKARVVCCTESVIDRLAYRRDHDGLFAVARQFSHSLDELLPLTAVPLLLVVVGIEKPGNLGSMFRIADSAGVDAIVVCDPATDVFNPNVIRSSRGTVCTVPFAVTSSRLAGRWFEQQRICVRLSSPDSPVRYWDEDLTKPTALVVGSESYGIGEEWLKSSHDWISLPQQGFADSMNAAMSAAVLLYEARRQREHR